MLGGMAVGCGSGDAVGNGVEATTMRVGAAVGVAVSARVVAVADCPHAAISPLRASAAELDRTSRRVMGASRIVALQAEPVTAASPFRLTFSLRAGPMMSQYSIVHQTLISHRLTAARQSPTLI